MLIRINDEELTIGQAASPEATARAELRRPGFWRRLLRRDPPGTLRLEARNCSVDCFGGAFSLYPCTHAYLTPDRRWETDVQVLLREGRVTTAVLRVIEGRYAASEFVDRFRSACHRILGAPHAVDPYCARWRHDRAEVTSILQRDTRNACFLFEERSA